MNREVYIKRFAKLCDEEIATTAKKNGDYASGEDAFQNFRNVEALGLTTVEIGILTRMSDKMQRVCNLVTRGDGPAVVSESVCDTLTDLAVYAKILRIYIEHKRELRKVQEEEYNKRAANPAMAHDEFYRPERPFNLRPGQSRIDTTINQTEDAVKQAERNIGITHRTNSNEGPNY